MSDHGPIQPELVEPMKQIGRAIDEFLNPGTRGLLLPGLPGGGVGQVKDRAAQKWGFVLITFPFDKDGQTISDPRSNYLSNARREDIVGLLKELVRKFEGEAHG